MLLSLFRLGSLSKESKPEKDAKDDNEGKTETSTATGKHGHFVILIRYMEHINLSKTGLSMFYKIHYAQQMRSWGTALLN